MTNINQSGSLFPIYGKINNVPNHQPGNIDIHTYYTKLKSLFAMATIISPGSSTSDWGLC
jgi:hypothetical protein